MICHPFLPGSNHRPRVRLPLLLLAGCVLLFVRARVSAVNNTVPHAALTGTDGLPSVQTLDTGWLGGGALGLEAYGRVSFAAGGTVSQVIMTGNATLASTSLPGSGNLAFAGASGDAVMKFGLQSTAQYRVVYNGQPYEGALPYLPSWANTDILFADEKKFTPYLLGESLTLEDGVDTLEVANPTFPVPEFPAIIVNARIRLTVSVSNRIDGVSLNTSVGNITSAGALISVPVEGDSVTISGIAQAAKNTVTMTFQPSVAIGAQVGPFKFESQPFPVNLPLTLPPILVTTSPGASVTFSTSRNISLNGDLAFNSVSVGSTAVKTLTIGNTGSWPLMIKNVNCPAGYSGKWTGMIEPGKSVDVPITFAPSATASYNGAISIESDATAGPGSLAVSGSGGDGGSGSGGGTIPSLAGTYTIAESLVYVTSAAGDSETQRLSGTVPGIPITQSGNTFSYSYVEPGIGLTVQRTFTLSGNNIISASGPGLFVVTAPGVTVAQNTLVAVSGTAKPGLISIHLEGRVTGSYQGVPFTINGTDDATLTNPTLAAPSAAAVTPPQVSTALTNRTVVAGGSTTLTVAASSSGTVSYQWYKNGALIPGVSSATLTLSNLQPADSGVYVVTASNSGGNVSSSATVAVSAPPAVLAQPLSFSIAPGGGGTLAVRAGGPGLTYQWYQGTSGDISRPISGATAATLKVSQVASTSNYWVKITGSAGTSNSQTATVTVSGSDLRTGLAGYWNFDTSDASDASGTNSIAVVTNGVTFPDGIIGQSVQFDGTSGYVEIPSFNAQPANQATVCLWVKQTSPQNKLQDILSHRGTASDINCWLMTAADGKYDFAWTIGGAVIHGTASPTIGTAGVVAPTAGGWDFIALTYDGSNVRFYVNGALQGTTRATGSIASCTLPWRFGAASSDVSNPFRGSIDEVRVYGRALITADLEILRSQAAGAARLLNLSVLTSLDTPGSLLTVGTVIGGAGTVGTKAVLIRAGGPSLATFGVSNCLADPTMDLFVGQSVVASNDNWLGSAALTSVISQTGAYPFPAIDSKDAAIYDRALPAGPTTVQITGIGGTTGNVIAELYDATPGVAFTPTTPRLINLSVLQSVTGTLTAGFVIGGSGGKTVLIRAVGPTLGLAPFGLSGVMSDPKVTLFNGNTPIESNDDWGVPVGAGAASGAQLANTFTQVGAFALSANSKDAALVVTLQPGNYTAQVSRGTGAAGRVLIEVYEVK